MRIVAAIVALIVGTTSALALEFSRHENDSATLAAVMARGKIEPGDAARFRKYLASVPTRKRVAIYLDSPGGRLYEGMRLGLAFHELGVRTVIEGNGAICLSACALAFLAGQDGAGKPWRTKSSTSLLGFHSWESQIPDGKAYTAADMRELERDTQKTVLDVADYLKTIGTDLEFLRVMFRASASDMNFVSNPEAIKIGIKVWDEKSNSFQQ
ncbi:hypothetical protein [Xanthobacter flavus]|uniref:COG3904 family protein n=1 Tax=Xanthobacter flavus TaxID=281 RepID=UPI001AE5E7C1|nr:hypothetical protein [Xanthobacter flavus]MBP2147428.1 hypothetical protein [Xanthobacter flavus]